MENERRCYLSFTRSRISTWDIESRPVSRTDPNQIQPVRHESDLIVHYAMRIANTISSAMQV